MSLFHDHVNKYASYYKAAGAPPSARVEFKSTPNGSLVNSLVRYFGQYLPKVISFDSGEADTSKADTSKARPVSSNAPILRKLIELPKAAVPSETPPTTGYVGPNLPAKTPSIIT